MSTSTIPTTESLEVQVWTAGYRQHSAEVTWQKPTRLMQVIVRSEDGRELASATVPRDRVAPDPKDL